VIKMIDSIVRPLIDNDPKLTARRRAV